MMQNNEAGIYKITNLINNKIYIGSAARSFRKRWNEHKSGLKNNRHTNHHLQSAWNKYGENSFEFKILEECSNDVILEREQYYLDLMKPEYNKCLFAGNSKGRPCSNETREKISKANKGTLAGENNPCFGRVGEDNPRYGVKLTEEHKKKFSRKGIKHTEETKQKIREAMIKARNSKKDE